MIKSKFSSDFELAILGGGQLGKMLLYETRKWDVKTRVLDPSPEAPCRMSANRFTVGDLMDFDTVLHFARGADVVTIEIEHVNTDALLQLQREGVAVYPPPQALAIIQNKVAQKKHYAEHGLPTARFEVFSDATSVREAVDSGRWVLPAVWKAATGGYDGKGVRILHSMDDVLDLPHTECLLEEKVKFVHELGVIVARSESRGEHQTYTPVEMDFHPEANLVEFVISPARVDAAIEKRAREIAIRAADSFHMTGLLAVELFLLEDGTVLINEVAPRPHNSGHLTIEGHYTNQFEQHLRAILDLPLGSTAQKCPAVMVNIVGAEGHSGIVNYEGVESLLQMPGVTPHIYGKKETRPWRKMGHITCVADSLEDALHSAEIAKDTIRATNL